MARKKRILAGVVAAILLFGCFSATVSATEVEETDTKVVNIPGSEVDSVYGMQVDSNQIEGWPTGPKIYSEAGIVMDVDSGAILYAKNIDDRHYPASITKVATALVALEEFKMDEIVKVTKDDISFLEYGDAHIGLKPDEEITMWDAMHGMLLASGNEVSHAIGAHYKDGYDAFMVRMNERVKELGCENTHFVNTYGLHDDNHYTSVHDMAIIGSAVFQNETFRQITGTKQHTIPETNITNETRTFQQNHKMLFESRQQYYEYCVGGKTGFTDQALTTLVTFAVKDDMRLVSVVMRTHGGGLNSYVDTRAMMDYAFDHFQKVPVTKENLEIEGVDSLADQAYVVLPQDVSMEQLTMTYEEPKNLGEKTGKVTYTYGETPVGSFGVTITEERYQKIHGLDQVTEKKEEASKKMPVIVKVILGVIIFIVAAYIALVLYVSYKRKQRRKRRQLQRMARRMEREGR